MRAIILAAGKGTRLMPYTQDRPKALVDLCDRPLIEHILQILPKQITEIVIVVGYLGDQITAHIGNEWEGRSVHYVVQDTLQGTGDAVSLAQSWVQGKTMVLMGDNIYSADGLDELARVDDWGILLTTMNDVRSPAMVDAGRFIGYTSEHAKKALGTCGAYVLDERYFNLSQISMPASSGEEVSLPHTFAQAANKIVIDAIETLTWYGVGKPEELAYVESKICPR